MNDNKNPAFAQGEKNLQLASNMAASPAGQAPSPVAAPNRTLAAATGACEATETKASPVQSCRQRLKLSFYFDGTGNNRDADVPTYEHSNVARMYLAAPVNSAERGTHSFYVPGLGTYFMDIGDPGESFGKAFGSKGEARLQWALQKFQERRSAARNFIGIDIAVFGFSRGAALARAFVNRIQRLCVPSPKGMGWVLKGSSVAVDVYFLGLWDTVASVGLPKSFNNQSMRGLVAGGVGASPASLMAERSVVDIAYGEPGADPSPSTLFGWADGHKDWGSEMAIPAIVSKGVHMMAGHEIRNSFPVDSVMQGAVRSAAFAAEEYIYPGVHSDVGGGYRPGEGGRAVKKGQQLSLVTLRVMYDKARSAGVPLLDLQDMQVAARRRLDFAMALPNDPEENQAAAREYDEMTRLWNRYMNYCGRGSRPMGQWFLAHMKAYYAWRFWNIRKNQVARQGRNPTDDEKGAKPLEQTSKAEQADLERKIEAEENSPAVRQAREATAKARRNVQFEQQRLTSLQQSPNGWMSPMTAEQARDFAANRNQQIAAQRAKVTQAKADLAATEKAQATAEDPMRRLEARKATLPSQGSLAGHWRDYDERLYFDGKVLSSAGHRKRWLRPHYKALVEAWEAEFLHNKGLIDADVMKFFERHVHDSLADFAMDATLPSDPRVVYVGGDEIELYASVTHGASEVQAA